MGNVSVEHNAPLLQSYNKRHQHCTWGDISYIVKKKHSDSTKKFSETDIIKMLEFFIDNIFVMFGGRVFQERAGMPINTNCTPLLPDLFPYSHEEDFIPGFLKKNQKEASPNL